MVRRRTRPPAAGKAPRSDAPLRVVWLDTLRGCALLWMAAFHLCFDLSHFRLIAADFYRDPLWTTQRTLILSLFLFCAGAGQALAQANGQSTSAFWKRWLQIAACALAVTAGSAILFPASFISFGVLHGIAAMLLIARYSGRLGLWLWPAGALALALPGFVQHAFFDSRLSNWIGFVTHKPVTEDFVPVFPWLGVLWWGMATVQFLAQRHPDLLLAGPEGAAARRLARLGRCSLSFYMLHQPILLGGLMLFLWAVRT